MVKYLGPGAWNLQLDDNTETNIIAEEDDLIFEIGGIFFLVQRKNKYNNIVCKRICSSKMTFKEVIKDFKKVMEDNGLQYIRVEGSTKRYKFLFKMLPELFDDVNILQDKDITERNVFYIKCYGD